MVAYVKHQGGTVKVTYTRATAKLVEDAKQAGYQIVERNNNEHGDSTLLIHRLNRNKVTIGVNISVFKGTFWSAFRTDVELAQTINIRTIKAVRKILGLD